MKARVRYYTISNYPFDDPDNIYNFTFEIESTNEQANEIKKEIDKVIDKYTVEDE